MTVDRFQGLCPMQNFWVVTNAAYVEIVRQQLPDIPAEHILAEPAARNTAPCIAWACWSIKREDPEANVVVTPADAVVMNPEEFRRVIKNALSFTDNHNAIVTIGIKPSRPETGYGYVEALPATNGEICPVEAFKEKPDHETAEKYLKAGNYLWNAGIFVWNVGTIANALRVYQPTLSKIFEDLLPVYGTAKEQEAINKVFPQCENISIDYAIMEKAEEIYVFPASFGWSDLGTWGSLQENTERDIYGNALFGSNIDVYETTNCIVHATQEKRVVVQGLDGFIVAECDDTLLVCRLSDEQRIKQFSEEK